MLTRGDRYIAGLLLAFAMVSANAGIDEGRAALRRGDYATALGEIRPLAEQGNPAAQTILGYMYSDRLGIARDEREAVKWFRKAADQGDAVAELNLGMKYSEGRGVAKHDEEVLKWYRKAADQGLAVAQHAT